MTQPAPHRPGRRVDGPVPNALRSGTALLRDRRRALSAALAGVTVVGAAAFLPGLAAAAPTASPDAAHCTASGTTTTCRYAPADGQIDFTVPTGVDTFTVAASGAGGGRGGNDDYNPFNVIPGGSGAAGSLLTGEVTVGTDRTYGLVVGARGSLGDNHNLVTVPGGTGAGDGGAGGAGAHGASGGGGGGATSIVQGGGSRVVLVAGGGAGGGGAGDQGSGAAARSADPSATSGTDVGAAGGTGVFGALRDGAGGGGGGGGLAGGAGGDAGSFSGGGDGGVGGTSSAFGTASTGSAGDGSLTITFVTPAAPPTTTPPTTTPPTTTPPTTGIGSDLVAAVDAPSRLTMGQRATVTVTVTNRGSATATRVSSQVYVPQVLRVDGVVGRPRTSVGPTYRFDVAALGAGESRTYTFSVVAAGPNTAATVTAKATSQSREMFRRDNYARSSVRISGTR